MRRVSLALLIALALSTFPAATARADIYQWAWVNPSDQTQGKYQSTTLCPGGKGVNAVPSANLNSCDLTQAYLIGGDLTAATLQAANLTNADLSAVNCTNASFEYADYHSGYNIPATLTNANLSGANLTSANFGSASLSNANLSGANLTSAIFCNEWSGGANLTNANLNGANLTNASFFDAAWGGANLTNANLTNAIVQGASLGGVSGITAAQLYSTASYAAGDLAGISLSWRNLTSWSFAGQNLANANFFGVTLSNADLTNANVRNVDFTEASGLTAAQLYSTASYKAKDLTGIVFGKWSGSALPGLNFTSWNFAGQNLTKVSFYNATLTGADLTGANVTGADFAHTTAKGFTAAQLYSTASYQAKDLTGIRLYRDDLTGWNFAGQNLTNATFGTNILDWGACTLTNTNLSGANLTNAYFHYATLTNANLSGANLTNAYFGTATLAGANLTDATFTGAHFISGILDGADARGATGLSTSGASSMQNLIMPDGSVSGLNLSGRTLVVRNYTASSIPVTVHTSAAMGTNGTLQMILDGSAWGSTISFDSGIPVSLGGTLDVTFASGVNLLNMVGTPVQLFNWAGVTTSGQFTWQDELGGSGSTYVWDAGHLYDAGTVTLYLRGDATHDGVVTAADIDAVYHNFGAAACSQWKVDGDGTPVCQADVDCLLKNVLHKAYGDVNLDGKVDFGDFQVLLDHWLHSGAGWTAGDFTGNGTVDFGDFQRLLDNWNPIGAFESPVPEPATLTLLALGAVGLLRRKK